MFVRRSPSSRAFGTLRILSALALLIVAPHGAAESRPTPNILIVTVDTLRWDRLSFNGYERPTSPQIDALMGSSASFSQARTPEPLTAPSMSSLVTSLHPHEHATSRNGMRLRVGLSSFVKLLARRRYDTAAFVSNWTLKDKISGLGEHFDEYHEVFTRTRWYLFNREADADDVSEQALDWIADRDTNHPFLMWVHYIDPHAPYRFHRELARGLEIGEKDPSPSQRYDTEVAFVDRAVGSLLDGAQQTLESSADDLLVVFAADHGESLGEHGYWGHGRHLYEPNLRIPLSIGWQGRIAPRVVDAPASLLDVGPTILGLLGMPIPEKYRGFDFSPVLLGTGSLPEQRTTWHQTHKGAILNHKRARTRSSGLLAVARVVDGSTKEILYVKKGEVLNFDLVADRGELADSSADRSTDLMEWFEQVNAGLEVADTMPTEALDEESIEKLRALGYIE